MHRVEQNKFYKASDFLAVLGKGLGLAQFQYNTIQYGSGSSVNEKNVQCD